MTAETYLFWWAFIEFVWIVQWVLYYLRLLLWICHVPIVVLVNKLWGIALCLGPAVRANLLL